MENQNVNQAENVKDKNKKYARIAAIIVAVFIAAASFGLGFMVKGYTQNKYVSSYDWVLRNIRDHYYYEIDEDDVYKVGLLNLRGTVLDAYSGYYTPEQYENLIATTYGNQSGIGVGYGFVQGKGVLISEVLGNSPAYRSGLRAGTFVSGATCGDESVSFNSIRDFVSFVTARAADEEFTFITDHGQFTMAKKNYVSSYCAMATKTDAWDVLYDENGSMQVVSVAENAMSFLPDDTAYLSFCEFSGNAAAEMAQLISRYNAAECKTLILDLRNNGGGSVDVLCNVAGLFTGNRQCISDVAITARYKNGKEEVENINYWASGECLLPADSNVFVLANSNSASASEALLGVLVSNGITPYENIYISDFSQEYLNWSGSAEKNCKTYGKGIMQTTYPNFFTGEAISLTTAVVYWPNGKTIHGVGLTVEDGCRTVDAEWCVTYYDEELQAAVADIAAHLYS